MPVDPKGTAPGTVPQQKELPRVNMKCKQCDSIEAEEIPIPGQNSQRLYRCVKCGAARGLNVGGAINL